MKTPKTPIEFDYDLWTTEDGKCMVRVKRTGEVTEVDREVMRILRLEEKKLRRSKTGVPVSGCDDPDETATLLSLDFVSVPEAEEMSPAWLEAPFHMETSVITQMLEDELCRALTPTQLDIYQKCMIEGQSYRAYAAEKGVSHQSVHQVALRIRKLAKKIFDF